MKELKERILFKGMHYKVNGKREFMKQILHMSQTQQGIARIIQQPHIMKKFLKEEVSHGTGRTRCFEMREEDLDLIFDEWIGPNLYNNKALEEGENARFIQQYLQPVFQDGEESRYEIRELVAYGIITNEMCKDMIEEVFTAHPEYYTYFQQHETPNQYFESAIDAKKIIYARFLIGMIEKMREEQSEEIYQEFMQIIYAGYRYLKNELKGCNCLTADWIRSIVNKEIERLSRNMISAVCEVPILLIIAEDKGIEISMDYETIMFLEMIGGYAAELILGREIEVKETRKLTKTEKEFLENFSEKCGTVSSMTELYVANESEGMPYVKTTEQILAMYNISPRKFGNYDLTKKEVDAIISQADKWNTKLYWYNLNLAVLCKYINSLEEVVINISAKNLYAKEYELKGQKEAFEKERKAFINAKKGLMEKMQKQDAAIIKLEGMIQKQKEENILLQQKIDFDGKELAELRNYIHGMSEEWQEADKLKDDRIQFWREQKVIVVGGHENWQGKLKELFPQWQFIKAENKMISDNVIRDKDYIICNTEVLAHAVYYKVLAIRNSGQKFLYVHSNNIGLALKELDAQIWT